MQYRKRKGKKNFTKKKGEVCMQTAIREKVAALNKRALQRRISFPNQKDEKNIRIENELFDEMKEEMYKQIAEDKKWN